MIAFVAGMIVGAAFGFLAGGLFIYKRYRPALRSFYEFLDTHAPRDQSDIIARRIARDSKAAP